MTSLFEGNVHAELYQKYRLATPAFVVDKIVSWMQQQPASKDSPPPTLAVAADIGCGSGQNTTAFAPHFTRVYGFDVSAAMIAEAQRQTLPDNVTFAVAPAERLPLDDHSVQLVTGSFSFHWFDLDRFYAEVDRVLAPNGVVAAIGHNTLTAVHEEKGCELNKLMADFVTDTLSKKTDKRAAYAFSEYQDLPLPYPEQLRVQNMPLLLNRNLAYILGSFSTWSPFQALYRQDPERMIKTSNQFRDDFLRILGLEIGTPEEEVPVVLSYDYFIAMCRKPATPTPI